MPDSFIAPLGLARVQASRTLYVEIAADSDCLKDGASAPARESTVHGTPKSGFR
jgi:hypothetical protein